MKYTYETKKPSTDEGLRQFLENALSIAAHAYRTKQQIIESFCDGSEISVSDPGVQEPLGGEGDVLKKLSNFGIPGGRAEGSGLLLVFHVKRNPGEWKRRL